MSLSVQRWDLVLPSVLMLLIVRSARNISRETFPEVSGADGRGRGVADKSAKILTTVAVQRDPLLL